MSNYIHTPKTISYRDIVDGGFSLSSSQHKKFEIPNQNCKLVRDFLTRDLARKDLGVEIGSINYIEKSSHYFLRTKALQAHSYLPEISPETALPIMPSRNNHHTIVYVQHKHVRQMVGISHKRFDASFEYLDHLDRKV